MSDTSSSACRLRNLRSTSVLMTAQFVAAILTLGFTNYLTPDDMTDAASSAGAGLTQGVPAAAAAVTLTSLSFEVCNRQLADPRVTFCIKPSTGSYSFTDSGKARPSQARSAGSSTSRQKQLRQIRPRPKRPGLVAVRAGRPDTCRRQIHTSNPGL